MIFFKKSQADKYNISQSTIEKLEYYVYLLIDPRNNETFYVGKGCGKRIIQHVLGADGIEEKETDKIKRIKEINKSGNQVKHYILRHGLSEKEAFEVESSIIDFIEKENLTNIVTGHHAEDRGLMTLEDIKIKYEAEVAEINEPVLLININNLYDRKMTQEEIYEATRKSWRVDIKRIEKIKICCSVFKGIIREVFVIDYWEPSKKVEGRHEFIGKIAQENIRDKYINKSVSKYWIQGSQNPIKYVNS